MSLRRSITPTTVLTVRLCAASRDEERELQRLDPVEARVADRLVAVGEPGLAEQLAAADALGDVVAGELDVDPTRPGAERAVDVEEALHLLDHVVEVAGLVARGGLERVAVHGVAHPRDLHAGGGDLLDQVREPVADPTRPEPGDERQPARLVVGVEPVGERQRVVGRRGRAELDADRVLDVAQQLDVRAVELTGPFADPDEVPGHVVRRVRARVDPGHGVLVLQHQGLVAGVEVDPVELVGVGADRLHERERAVDVVGHRLVLLAGGGLAHEVGVPGVHLAQVGVAAGDEGPHEVQRRRGRVVDVDEPLRVVGAGVGGEVEAVDGVAAVGRQGDVATGLEVGRPGLGVLTRDPAHLHDRHRGGVRQHDRHLEEHPQLVADVVGGDAVERLGAVTPLEQERLAAGHRGDLRLQVVALPREHQRRPGAQPGDRGVDRTRVEVRRLLGGPEGVQRLERRDGAHRTSVRVLARGDAAPGPRGRRPVLLLEVVLHVVDVAETGALGTRAAVDQPRDHPQHDADHQ